MGEASFSGLGGAEGGQDKGQGGKGKRGAKGVEAWAGVSISPYDYDQPELVAFYRPRKSLLTLI